MSQSPHYNQSRANQSSGSRNVFTRKLFKNYSYLKILVPYPDNTSSKAILKSILIKGQHEIIKLLNEEVTSKTLHKTFKMN